MSAEGRILLEQDRFLLCLERLCYQVVEQHKDIDKVCFIAVQPRGVYLADRIIRILNTWFPNTAIRYGKLDITFYRDDFRIRAKPLSANETVMDFLVQDQNVILLDDVLYTGRSIQAALTALQHYGRPAKVQLMALVDRRFNRELPIQAHFTGLTVDALDEAYVNVQWKEKEGADKIILFPKKQSSV
jgi:pyrimidine operon attenuation protein / uracil phosphoribosyltransferase